MKTFWSDVNRNQIQNHKQRINTVTMTKVQPRQQTLTVPQTATDSTCLCNCNTTYNNKSQIAISNGMRCFDVVKSNHGSNQPFPDSEEQRSSQAEQEMGARVCKYQLNFVFQVSCQLQYWN